MKKLFIMVFMGIVLSTVTSCGSKTTENPTDNDTVNVDTTTVDSCAQDSICLD